MTNIEFFIDNDGILLGFSAVGHSDDFSQGHDIVCAAISSATYMAVNTITDVINVDANVFVSDGNMTLQLQKSDAVLCQDILKGLKLHLISLEEQYNDKISVNYKEV